MVNSEVIDRVSLKQEEPKKYTFKTAYGNISSFEELTSSFVFYVPFVYDLIKNRTKSGYTTDVFSALIASVIGEHPLVITETAVKLFEAQPPILLLSDQKASERTVYAATTEAWNTVADNLSVAPAFDKENGTFCIFRMYEETVPCPFANFAGKPMKVHFCNMYGNKDTYYFAKPETEENPAVVPIMRLYRGAPIKEFVELGKTVLSAVNQSTGTDKAVAVLNDELEEQKNINVAMKKNVADIQPIHLCESQLTVSQKNDCMGLIKMYRELYLESPRQH